MTLKSLPIVVSTACLMLAGPALATANNDQLVDQQIQVMQQQIELLQDELEDLKAEQDDAAAVSDKELSVDIGGAVRFQYTYEDYQKNAGNTDRGGDIDFDTFRLDLRGAIGNVILDAQWRWYQYMTTLHHAWVGYNFNPDNQLQIGLTRIPFGNQPYNSHSFFFSSNYYLGLEDSYKFGLEYIYTGGAWNVQAAFFKNDGRGGVGHDRRESYTYNIVGIGGLTSGNVTNLAGTANTGALRVAHTFTPITDLKIEFGGSGLYGQLRSPTDNAGDYYAWAVHTDIDWGAWNLQLQGSRYEYDTDVNADRLVVAAYAYRDTIAASANTYTANLAYTQPVDWGPITSLMFYNDYSLVGNKSGNFDDTWMNVTGIAVAAGGVYAYIDWINARNQPFIGGSMTGNGEVNQRFNINIGYYF